MLLRAFGPDDVDALTAFQNDLATELLGGGDPPRPTTREWMAQLWERLSNDRSGASFVMEADGKVIGNLGLFNADLEARTMELGVTVGDKDYWGRGYGTEAIRLATDYAFRMRNVRKVHLSVLANNPRAIAAYTKVGFVEEGRRREHAWNAGAYVDLIYMGLFRPDA
ncbi:MAG: GNAT family N-acetyltransferase [Actinomycetales bacterium]